MGTEVLCFTDAARCGLLQREKWEGGNELGSGEKVSWPLPSLLGGWQNTAFPGSVHSYGSWLA